VKPLLLLVLFVSIPVQQQVEREESDLVVVKFSWTKEKPKSSPVIRGAQNPGGPVNNPIMDGRDLGSRKADLRTMQKANSKADPAERSSENYQSLLELKNTGANTVKSLVWEFRPTGGPDDYQPKQYLCAFEVKAKEKKVLEIWTPYVPVKIVSAGELMDAPKDGKEGKDGKVVINQIEYADGSVWKKRGWNYKLPDGASQKLPEGGCSVF